MTSKSFLAAARERAAEKTAVLSTGQANMATGMASTAPDTINVETNAALTPANDRDTGQGNAGEAPDVARAALSPVTTAPIDNERGGLPMSEDPDRAAGAKQAGQAVVKTIQPLIGVASDEALTEEEISKLAAAIEPSYEPYVPVEGDYKAKRLGQFYKADGKKVVPNKDGYYHPEDEEEVAMLEYYATLHDKVEAFNG